MQIFFNLKPLILFNLVEITMSYVLLGNNINLHHKEKVLVNPETLSLENRCISNKMLSSSIANSTLSVYSEQDKSVNVIFSYSFNNIDNFQGYKIHTKIKISASKDLGLINIINILS